LANTLTLQPARTRFTVRRMMVAVAIVAVLFGAAVELPRLWVLRQQYLGLAEKYGYWEIRLNGAVEIRQELTYYSTSQPLGPEPSPERLAKMKDQADHYARLRAKYERAARYPWLRIVPDPPVPY
jgi:hypothetical protein